MLIHDVILCATFLISTLNGSAFYSSLNYSSHEVLMVYSAYWVLQTRCVDTFAILFQLISNIDILLNQGA